jgi:hypothetical protein
MDDYIGELNMYLPIDFADTENDEYRQYLMDTFLENCQNEKYQFALMAFHMMFMSFLYKEFWELKTFSFSKVSGLCRADAKFNNINNIFDASIIPEKTMIDQYLSSIYSWHLNKRDAVKAFVDKRDNCAHASGFVQYRKADAERYFQDVLEYTQKISKANKPNIVLMFFEQLKSYLENSDEFNSKTTGEFVFDKVKDIKLSYIDITYILKEPIPQYISDDESCMFKVAYYFAMMQLHSLFLQHISTTSLSDDLSMDEFYFSDQLYLLMETIDSDKRATLQIQSEDELEYLQSTGYTATLEKLAEIIHSN